MSLSWPFINASLNFGSAVFLVIGFLFIRGKQTTKHRAAMVTAFSLSTLFLISYVTYHAITGVVHYQKTGMIRTVYFALLTSHTILAAIIVPLVLRTLYLAAKGRFEAHRRWARWTLPLWFYVSVTGVVIYEMLY